jgi:hypothetical protein
MAGMSDADVGLGGGAGFSDADVGLGSPPAAPATRMLNADLPQRFQAPANPYEGMSYGNTLDAYFQAGADKVKNAFAEIKSASNPLTPSFSAPFRTAGALADIPMGAAQFIAAPATAAFRHYVSGPEEKYVGIPAGEFEGALQAAGPAKASGALSMIPRRAASPVPEINPAVAPRGSALSLPSTLQRAPLAGMGALEDALGVNDIAPAAASSSPAAQTRPAGLLSADVPHEMPTGRASVGAAGAPDPLAEYSPHTIAKVRADLQQAFPTPHLLEQALDERSAHHMLGELSPDLEAKMGGLAASAGPERAEIVQSLKDRAKEAEPRMSAALDRTFGPYQNRQTLRRLLDEQRSLESDPFWEEFHSAQIHPTNELKALLPRLREAGALQAAEKALGVEGRPKNFAWATGGKPERMPTAAAYQYAKEHLDDLIETNLARPGGENAARRFTQLKNDLVRAIDNHPDATVAGLWKAARDTYATPTRVMKAVDLGERLMTGNVHPEKLPDLIASMGPAERTALRIGMRGYFEDQFGRPGNVNRQIISNILSGNNRKKLAWAIGDERAESLINAIEHEQSMLDAPTRIHGNSPTAARTAAREEWMPSPSPLENIGVHDVLHPVKSAVKLAGKAGLGRLSARKQAEFARLRAEAARLYTLQGPERDAVARALLGYREHNVVPFARARGGAVPALSTRKESHYSPKRGTPDHHCGADRAWPHGSCAHYRKPNKCSLVAGFIAAHGGCSWYERGDK